VYYAIAGINILLLIVRCLKRMEFQPRLGVVTRSLSLAGADLIHFALVAAMVFIGYAMMAHLIFGNSIFVFATFERSVNTCFEILLGNIDVQTELAALTGLQGVAGTLFFWSYELLVFMVLLNFLLAIIVDAFAEVKEATSETSGVHKEVADIVRDRWRLLVGRATNSYLPDAKLRRMLQAGAGSTEEQEAADLAARQEEASIKLLRLLGEDIDEDTLREILLACLSVASRTGPDDGSKGFWGFLPWARKKSAVAPRPTSDEDVSLAVKYIIDRFGAPGKAPDAVEDEEGGEETERDQLAAALQRLANVQAELADSQRTLLSGQNRLADQQKQLVELMNS